MNFINQKGESGKWYAIGRKEKVIVRVRGERKGGGKKRRRSEGSGGGEPEAVRLGELITPR